MNRIFFVLTLFSCCCSLSLAIDEPQSDFQAESTSAELQQNLRNNTRTEQQQDRLHATTLFAHGRMYFRQRNFEQALKNYQRAWRYDTSVISITKELIPLAISLKKNHVAIQYAELALESGNLDAQSLGRIAVLLAQNKKQKTALKAYQKLLEVRPANQKDNAYVAIHVEIGRLAFLTGNMQVSAAAYDIVRDVFDNPASYQMSEANHKQLQGQGGAIFLIMGEAYLQTSQFDKAEAAFTKAQQRNSNESLNAFRLATLDFARKQFAACREHLKQYFDSKSIQASTAPYELLIKVNRQLQQNQTEADEASIMTLTSLSLEQTSNHFLAYTLAELMVDHPKYRSASLEFLRRFLPTEPSSAGYQKAFACLLKSESEILQLTDAQAMELVWILANFYARERNFKSLGDDYITQLGDQPGLLEQMVRVTTAYAKQSTIPSNTPVALKAFPGHSAAAMALVFITREDWKQAEKFFQLAMQAAPNQSSLFFETWGIQSYLAGRTAEAVAIFEKAIESDSVKQKMPFYFFLAGAALALKDESKALKAAELASQLGHSNPRLLSRFPWILYQTGNYEKAEQLYTDLVNQFHDQTNNPAINEVVQESKMILSNICIHLEKQEAAVEWLEQILDNDPQHIGTLNDLGYLWADQNKHLKRATNMLEIAVRAQPENQSYRDSLGWVYYRLGDFQRAKIELETAASGESADGVILDHLGDTYLQLGDKSKARQLWLKAIEAFDPIRNTKEIKLVNQKLKTTQE